MPVASHRALASPVTGAQWWTLHWWWLWWACHGHGHGAWTFWSPLSCLSYAAQQIHYLCHSAHHLCPPTCCCDANVHLRHVLRRHCPPTLIKHENRSTVGRGLRLRTREMATTTASQSPVLDGAQTTTGKVPRAVLTQRASLKKDSRYTRTQQQHHNTTNNTTINTNTIAGAAASLEAPSAHPLHGAAARRIVDRTSLRVPRETGHAAPKKPGAPAAAAKPPMKTRRPSEGLHKNAAAGSAYDRTANGRQFTVGNIGNGGRIYLR